MEAGHLLPSSRGAATKQGGNSRTESKLSTASKIAPPLNRPVSYVCYLCGCQFGSQSLFIHIGRCEEKWGKVEAAKAPRDRRPLPPSPLELERCELPTHPSEIEAFNNKMFNYYNTVSLYTCSGCGRSFNEEAYSKHVAKCTGGTSSAPASGPAAKPLGYVCYICGQQYGSRSLRIHISNCQEKWERKESVKPTRERRPVPAPPPGFDPEAPLPDGKSAIEEFNMRMFQAYNESSLYKCQSCARTFNEEAFARHAKICKGGQQAKGAPAIASGSNQSRQPQGIPASMPQQKPRAFTCYLCGQQYGSQSLKIHIPKCEQRFENEQAQKASRRPLPAPPPELDDPLPTTAAGIDAFNAKMFQIYNNCSLATCSGCGRSFHSEAYDKHVLRCTGNTTGAGAAKSPPSSGLPRARNNATGTSGTLRTYCCYLCAPVLHASTAIKCGQQFGSSSLKIHLKTCEEKWECTEAQKPAHERQPRPAAPPELMQALPDKAAGIEQFNAKMTSIYNSASLTPCPHCRRTFTTAAWKNHKKICTADRPMRSAPTVTQGAAKEIVGPTMSVPESAPGCSTDGSPQSKQYPEPQEYPPTDQALDKCESCGRSFNVSALQRHMKVCKKVFSTTRKPMDMEKRRKQGFVAE